MFATNYHYQVYPGVHLHAFTHLSCIHDLFVPGEPLLPAGCGALVWGFEDGLYALPPYQDHACLGLLTHSIPEVPYGHESPTSQILLEPNPVNSKISVHYHRANDNNRRIGAARNGPCYDRRQLGMTLTKLRVRGLAAGAPAARGTGPPPRGAAGRRGPLHGGQPSALEHPNDV